VPLLDFGFSPSFTRNITYVFSGVRSLKAEGVSDVNRTDRAVDYSLLKGVISAMRWFYLRVALILFVLLISLGTYYIYTLMQNFHGDRHEVYIAWMLLCIINTYNLYTLYYDSLLQGKGLIKRSKQIVILGQMTYLIVAAVLIMAGYGLIAIVSAQALSVIIVRLLSYHYFFTSEIKNSLDAVVPFSQKEILKAIYPNSVKMGLTFFGGFLVTRSAMVIGSLYLTLNEIASYGIAMQLISVIASLAGIYTATYQPKIAQQRVEKNIAVIKELYLKGQGVLFSTYFLGGLCLVILGEWTLRLIGSQTHLMPQSILAMAIIVSFLESNHAIAGSILLSKNEVPFFKASLLSGVAVVLGLLLMFKFTNLRLIVMVLVPFVVDISYQSWKWPWEVIKELKISIKEYFILFWLNPERNL
jgi:O-antigen/teichoic acid export membrane protein